jgi:hypothetical protein
MMNVMLVNSSTPDNLWGEAILSACYLQNKISYKKTGLTPYKLWKDYSSNLKYLKVWGCLAKVMSLEQKKKDKFKNFWLYIYWLCWKYCCI